MKTVYWLLGACVVFLVMGTAVIWYLHTEPASVVAAENAQREPEAHRADTSQRKSPVLGKEIAGLPEYCADKLISVSGCEGMTEITTDQGNTYRLVEVGDQCWFADNLKEIPSTDQWWYGFYDNAEEEPAPGEGMLYTWDTAMNGETEERTQGVCPSGWHLPSDCELLHLEKIVGVEVYDQIDENIYDATPRTWQQKNRLNNVLYSSWGPVREVIAWTSTSQENSPLARWMRESGSLDYFHLRLAETDRGYGDLRRIKGKVKCLMN